MKIPGTVYQVGGSVRDKIMGKPISDLDYVVVGATEEEMINAGFEKVGADFPVFLHPETKDEYALARTERKTGVGYNGFTTYSDKTVTLEEDLARRDLTMNAMAMDKNGNIIDPFGGQKDIKDRKIKHVSAAFSEDPLRILRVARFAARFGFDIHPETMDLMRQIYISGETKHLTKERIWKETSRAIMHDNAIIYFSVLQKVGLGSDILPGMPYWEFKGFEEFIDKDYSLSGKEEIFLNNLKDASLESRIARWSLPISLIKCHNDAMNWSNIGASKEVSNRISMTQIIWNTFYDKPIDYSLKPNSDWLKLIVELDALRRPQRWIDAFHDVKNQFIISGKVDMFPETETLITWINSLKVDAGKIAKEGPKETIAARIKETRTNQWIDLVNSYNNKKKYKI